MKKGSAGTLLPEAGRDKRQGEAPPRRRADSAFPSANGSRPKPRAADRTALSALQSVQALAHRRFNPRLVQPALGDRKSTRLNSSHVKSSYAVFCLKIKK